MHNVMKMSNQELFFYVIKDCHKLKVTDIHETGTHKKVTPLCVISPLTLNVFIK